MQKTSVVWLRRDLRLIDNTALYYALKSGNPVLVFFIFDTEILDKLEDKADRRVTFLYHTISEVNESLKEYGSAIHVLYDTPIAAWKKLTEKHEIASVFVNRDYEPYARKRDGEVKAFLDERKIPLYSFKDQVIFEEQEVVKEDGKPYTVFTPYSNKWKLKLNDFFIKSYPTEKYVNNYLQWEGSISPSLSEMGFLETENRFPSKLIQTEILSHYDKTRDFPGKLGTSRLGIHLRFGTISIRHLAQKAKGSNEIYLNELIWRDFYQMILWHFPQVEHHAFKEQYDKIKWRNDEGDFLAWCEGKTGYPLVDAGMREMNQTGYMHNRVRMVTASFLSKHLLIDWRWGEAYFAKKLLDFDLASNNGGWQWAAGCGTDAAPYFRVFNPTLQREKFDPKNEYVKRWVPEWEDASYPSPIVSHELARNRCLETYKEGLNS